MQKKKKRIWDMFWCCCCWCCCCCCYFSHWFDKSLYAATIEMETHNIALTLTAYVSILYMACLNVIWVLYKIILIFTPSKCAFYKAVYRLHINICIYLYISTLPTFLLAAFILLLNLYISN